MKAFPIDAADFCRLKERVADEVAVAELGRLAQECADASGTLRWSLQGGIDSAGHDRLELSIAGTVQLICQRCLAPFAHRIASEAILILAPDEESADQIEQLLEDDAIDVIVGAKRLDVMALVEDEALLALPIAPKHEVCPDPAVAGRREGEPEPSPFSVLKNWKR